MARSVNPKAQDFERLMKRISELEFRTDAFGTEILDKDLLNWQLQRKVCFLGLQGLQCTVSVHVYL